MERNRYYSFSCPLCGKKTTHILNHGREIKKCDKCRKHFVAELIVDTRVILRRIEEHWIKEEKL